MAQFVISPTIRACLQRSLVLCSNEQQTEFKEYLDEETVSIPFQVLSQLSQVLRSESNRTDSEDTEQAKDEQKQAENPCYLHEILRGSELYFETKEKPKDPLIVAALKQAKIRLDNQRYLNMTEKIRRPRFMEEFEERRDLKTFKSQGSIGLNVIVTMGVLFIFGYYSVYYSTRNKAWAVIGGGCGLIVGLLVESWLFISGHSMMEKHLERKARQEQKTFKISS